MRAFAPLPIRNDWAPSYLRARGDANRDFAYSYRDAQGAPSADGSRYHSAVDWFAPGGTVVRSPSAGRVVRSEPSRGNSGQVYGGVIAVQLPSGLVWVMRHVAPRATVGRQVEAADAIATVVGWADSPASSHAHIELWRSLAGGYQHENMLDPRDVEWFTEVPHAVKTPPPHGVSLRLAIRTAADRRAGVAGRRWAGNDQGWGDAEGALRWIKANGLSASSDVALSWQGVVRRYSHEHPRVIEITENGRTRRVRGSVRDLRNVAATLVNRYL